MSLYEEGVRRSYEMYRKGLGYRGLLSTGPFGVGVPDIPPEWRYGLPSYERTREAVARLVVEQGLPDAVAWDASFDPAKLWELRADHLRSVVRRRKERDREERRRRREDLEKARGEQGVLA